MALYSQKKSFLWQYFAKLFEVFKPYKRMRTLCK